MAHLNQTMDGKLCFSDLCFAQLMNSEWLTGISNTTFQQSQLNGDFYFLFFVFHLQTILLHEIGADVRMIHSFWKPISKIIAQSIDMQISKYMYIILIYPFPSTICVWSVPKYQSNFNIQIQAFILLCAYQTAIGSGNVTKLIGILQMCNFG